MKHITVAFTSCVIESGSKIISGDYNFPYISIILSHKKEDFYLKRESLDFQGL